MFTPEHREEVRAQLVTLARQDSRVTRAAHTGSFASGKTDRWSDIDLVLGVRGDLVAVLAKWTDVLYQEHRAVHHWDLPVGSAIYRVFLLPGWLEVDLGVFPESDFGPRGPHWEVIFGSADRSIPDALPDPDFALAHPEWVLGRCWHHALHAAAAIDRGRLWQAEWWISEARRHLMELACLRHGLPTSYGRGADSLPSTVAELLRAALVHELVSKEMWRALSAINKGLVMEVARADRDLAERLARMLQELVPQEKSA